MSEEIETLETIAMILAELLSSKDFINQGAIHPEDGLWLRPNRMTGLRLSGGIGIGQAVLHHRQIHISKLIAEDPEIELVHLNTALGLMHRSLDVMMKSSELGDGEHLEILETYRMFAEDRGWITKITEHIHGGLTAEASVKKVYDDTWVRMSQITDPYLKERLHDMRDITDRLLQHLVGETSSSTTEQPDNIIVIARSMGPAELLDYDRHKVQGLILEEGTPTMHVAIIARALNIPVIAQIKDITEKIDSLDNIIVDGESGNIFIRPSEELLGSFSTKLKEREQRQAEYEAIKDKPSVTKDGIKIGLHLNAGLLHDLPLLKETSADGIGLYRTEIPFMSYPEMPDVNIQSNLYKKIIDEAENKPVIFRTLDIGADKMLPYCKDLVEDNPAIGWRSIRITLDRKGVLRSQFRALIRAAQGRELYIMFPMISEVAEFDAAKETLLIELQREKDRNGIIPKKLHVGTILPNNRMLM